MSIAAVSSPYSVISSIDASSDGGDGVVGTSLDGSGGDDGGDGVVGTLLSGSGGGDDVLDVIGSRYRISGSGFCLPCVR